MRDKIILICSQCLNRNYTTSKNKADKSKRLELKKFCQNCNAHTIHKESK